MPASSAGSRHEEAGTTAELAVAGGCDAIITYNVRDFGEAVVFGIEIMTPKQFLEQIGVL